MEHRTVSTTHDLRVWYLFVDIAQQAFINRVSQSWVYSRPRRLFRVVYRVGQSWVHSRPRRLFRVVLQYRLGGGGGSFNMGPSLVLISRHMSRSSRVSARIPEDIPVRQGVRTTYEVPTNVRRWRVERYPQEVP